jgi:hypothetical protein
MIYVDGLSRLAIAALFAAGSVTAPAVPAGVAIAPPVGRAIVHGYVSPLPIPTKPDHGRPIASSARTNQP